MRTRGFLPIAPAVVVFLSFTASALAWAIPERFYQHYWAFGRNVFDLTTLSLSLCWIFLLLLASHFGTQIGLRISSFRAANPSPSSNTFFYLFASSLAFVGTAASYQTILDGSSLSDVMSWFYDGLGNNLKFALYDNYIYGLHSLRYAAIVAGGLGLFHILSDRRKWLVLDWLNVLLLFGNTLISSRLSLLCASVITILHGILLGGVIRWRVLLCVGLAANFLVLANTVRNKNFYSERGIDDPLFAHIAQTIGYLAAPFEGLISSARSWLDGTPPDTGIAGEFTTNSALLEALEHFGTLGPLLAVLFIACGGILYGIGIRRASYAGITTAGVVLYGSFESFRLLYMLQGVFQSLLIIGCCGVLLDVFFRAANPRRVLLQRMALSPANR